MQVVSPVFFAGFMLCLLMVAACWLACCLLCLLLAGSILALLVVVSWDLLLLLSVCCWFAPGLCCSVFWVLFCFGSGSLFPCLFISCFSCRLCFALLVLACRLGLVAWFVVCLRGFVPYVSRDSVPCFVYACTVDLLVSSDVLFLIYIFLTFEKKKIQSNTSSSFIH